jgi:hypothetical protein
MVLGVESARVVWANPEEDESPIASPRRDKFSLLAVPLNLAAQAGCVLVRDPVRRDGALGANARSSRVFARSSR